VIRRLDPYGIVIEQYLHRLPPAPWIDIQAEVVEPNVARWPDHACELTESEEAPKAAGIDHAPVGTDDGLGGAPPLGDDRRLDGQQFGHAPGPKATLEPFKDAPAGLFLGRVLVVGAKPEP
jgi:hypothetical protein